MTQVKKRMSALAIRYRTGFAAAVFATGLCVITVLASATGAFGAVQAFADADDAVGIVDAALGADTTVWTGAVAEESAAEEPSERIGEEVEAALAEGLPGSFDLRNVNGRCFVTPARSQGKYGTCWAFSFLAAAESNYLMKTNADPSSISLSPAQLAYYCYNLPATVRAGLEGDRNTITEGGETGFNLGGNNKLAGMMSMAGVGLAAEADVPYSIIKGDGSDFSESTGFTDDMAYGRNSYTVKSTMYVSLEDRDAVKRYLTEYGAAQASYYSTSDSEDSGEKSRYYRDPTTGTVSHYQTYKTDTTNHGITIIGWDDDFSSFDPECTPIGTGAWLVKNSWGTNWGNRTADGGYDGCFWLSYYDPSLQVKDACFVEVEPTDGDELLYQYDGNGSKHGLYLDTAANVFRASADTVLDSVAFYSSSTNVNYTVQVYVNVTDSADPTSGTLAVNATASGTSIAAGYRHVDLSAPVAVEKGMAFSVVVTLSKSDGERASFGTDMTGLSSTHVQCTAHADPGESYFLWYGKWYDLATYDKWEGGADPANFRIKAYGDETRFDVADANVADIADVAYTGSEARPLLTVTYGNIRLTQGEDYTVTYTGNVDAGTAQAVVTGIGNYTGRRTVAFEIVANAQKADEAAGSNRYETAAAIARKAFPNGSRAAVVATGANYPDALGAAGFAGLLNCPILLTERDAVPEATATALRDLGVTSVYLVGGENAISQATASALKSLAGGGGSIVRISGESRYETAAAIYGKARELGYMWGGTAIVATGTSFADALSISGYAFAHGAPLFLASPDAGTESGLCAAAETALSNGGFSKVVIVGGTSAVPSSVETWIARNAAASTRLGGQDRYATSTLIAQFVIQSGGTANGACIATGTNYPDALAGGPLAGRRGTVMLLASTGSYGTFDNVLTPRRSSVGAICFLGGTAALPNTVRNAAMAALNR